MPSTAFGGLTEVCDAVSLVEFRTTVVSSSSESEVEGSTIFRNVDNYWPSDTTSHLMLSEHSNVIKFELPAIGQHSGTDIDWLKCAWLSAKYRYGSRRQFVY
jgi:hypothetical protein